MSLTVDRDDFADLPEGRDGDAAIGLRHIRLPKAERLDEDEFSTNLGPEKRHAVQDRAFDGPGTNHGVESKYGLGMAWIGMEYVPDRWSGPKERE